MPKRPVPPQQQVRRFLITNKNKVIRLRMDLYKPHLQIPLESGGIHYIFFDGTNHKVYSKGRGVAYEYQGVLDSKSQISMALGSCVSLIALRESAGELPPHSLEGVVCHISLPYLKLLSSAAKSLARPADYVDVALPIVENAFPRGERLRFLVIPGTTEFRPTKRIVAYINRYARQKNIPVITPPEKELKVQNKVVYFFKAPTREKTFGVRIEQR